MIDGRAVWADERGSGSKSKIYRCSGATFDTKENGDIRKVTKGCPDSMCVFVPVAGSDRKVFRGSAFCC